MDARGGRYDSGCSRGSNSRNNSNSGKGNGGDQGFSGQGGRGSPSDYYYGIGPTGEVKESFREEDDLYARNNNDYSKYNGGHLPSTSDYGYYAPESTASDYSPSSCDVNYGEEYGADNRYSHHPQYSSSNGSYPEYQRSYDCGDSQCYANGDQGSCRTCGRCSPSTCGGERCDLYGSCDQQQDYTPSRVQVTAKVLFGSVSAISNLKQKKCSKK